MEYWRLKPSSIRINDEEIMSQLPLRSARYVSSDLRVLFQADHVVFRGPNPSITASYLAELFFL